MTICELSLTPPWVPTPPPTGFEDGWLTSHSFFHQATFGGYLKTIDSLN